jgi:acyl carrier protein
VDKWNFAASELIEDLDRIKHYRRCAAVALRYSGPFECVDRVLWHTDWCFKVHVSAKTVPALLDAPLQVVCSLDALGRGATFIPFYIERFEAIHGLMTCCPPHSVAFGKLTVREDSYLQCDIEIYAVKSENRSNLVATMTGIRFTKVDDARHRPHAGGVASRRSESITNKSACPQGGTSQDGTSLLRSVVGLGSDLVGSVIDPSRTLFENGLHSLRTVELIGKINQKYGVNLSVAHLAGEDTFTAITSVLQIEIDAQDMAGSKRQRFAHVNNVALQRIVDARLVGAEAPVTSNTGRRRSALAEAARGVIYMFRRGFLKYLRIQYRDGLFRFLIDTPTSVDLDRTVIVPGSRVHFEQTDYNRHFTVREIVHDSERGFYNLVHASGLAHLEHYFRVMFFCESARSSL